MLLDDVIDALGDEVARPASGRASADAAGLAVTDVEQDSRRVAPGALFCCVPGATVDGHDFAPEAVAAGATALLVERPVDVGARGADVPQILVAHARIAMARAAVAVYDRPADRMTVVGVTGTNGKTTTTFLLRNIFAAAGRHVAVLGTLSGPRTTPESPDLQRWLVEQLRAGVDTVAMEVSSHALSMHRVDGTRFAAGVFTNLSRDHLDFHTSMESYFDAKARLFTPELTDLAIVNVDDPYGRLLHDAALVHTVTYGLDLAHGLVVGPETSSFVWRGHAVTVPIGGRFNVSNALAAAETAFALGIDAAVVAAGLARALIVPGRFEPVDAGQPFSVIVDYAHTPDALEHVLGAAREVAGQGRVHVVFGCGGDRDATKRPAMGSVAARGADRVLVTADNSRSEDTAAIIDAVKEGYDRTADRIATELVIEPDRRRAIALAVAGAASGDVVVLAGKGHETTQTIGSEVTPFDDRVVARDELARLGYDADEHEVSGA